MKDYQAMTSKQPLLSQNSLAAAIRRALRTPSIVPARAGAVPAKALQHLLWASLFATFNTQAYAAIIDVDGSTCTLPDGQRRWTVCHAYDRLAQPPTIPVCVAGSDRVQCRVR